MTTIKFDDFLKEKLNNPEFKEGYEAEYGKLASAAVLMKAREEAGLTQLEVKFI